MIVQSITFRHNWNLSFGLADLTLYCVKKTEERERKNTAISQRMEGRRVQRIISKTLPCNFDVLYIHIHIFSA